MEAIPFAQAGTATPALPRDTRSGRHAVLVWISERVLPLMIGRYCLKSTDGFWLIIRFGRDEYVTDPHPYPPALRGSGASPRVPPEPATSFFCKQAAADAAKHFGLPGLASVLAQRGYKSLEEMQAAGDSTPYWEIVPDPNP